MTPDNVNVVCHVPYVTSRCVAKVGQASRRAAAGPRGIALPVETFTSIYHIVGKHGSGSEPKGRDMGFGHGKLDVYRVGSIDPDPDTDPRSSPAAPPWQATPMQKNGFALVRSTLSVSINGKKFEKIYQDYFRKFFDQRAVRPCR